MIGGEVLNDPLADERHRQHKRQGQQQIGGNAVQIYPEVADGSHGMARKCTNQGKQHRDAGGGRKEILHRQAEHLCEVAHRRLTAVALPIGVGDEADGGVETGIRCSRSPCAGD